MSVGERGQLWPRFLVIARIIYRGVDTLAFRAISFFPLTAYLFLFRFPPLRRNRACIAGEAAGSH
jgi:hypothetical protein